MKDELETLIEPVVTGLGCRLWGIERLVQGRYSVLKVYIDADQGVDIDDCARVSRQLGAVLDVEEPIKGNYTLEVSSPGLDRRLFRPEQYELFKGSRVKLSLRMPFEGKRKFVGILGGIENEEVVFRSGEEEILFPFEMIERASIVPEF